MLSNDFVHSQSKGKQFIASQRENRHILKLTNITPEMAGRITCETVGDHTACVFEVVGMFSHIVYECVKYSTVQHCTPRNLLSLICLFRLCIFLEC